MASGIHKEGAAAEFLEHSNQEQQHADMIAERIKQLGGKPEMNPAVIANTSHSEYVEGNSLEDMLREDLVAERIAIQTYREMIQFFGQKDPTSRRLMEEILAVEEEHADDIADLLFAVQPDNVENTQKLYFADEVPGQSDAGKKIKSESAEKAQRKSKKAKAAKAGK
jgi:bacterioferritin